MSLLPRTPEELAQARADYEAKKAEWAKLPLRQTFADESHMREHLRVAGVRIASNVEPATVARVRQLLRRVGLLGDVVNEALGMGRDGPIGIDGYLQRNPGLPLWAAVALILELTGRYDAQVSRSRPVLDDGL